MQKNILLKLLLSLIITIAPFVQGMEMAKDNQPTTLNTSFEDKTSLLDTSYTCPDFWENRSFTTYYNNNIEQSITESTHELPEINEPSTDSQKIQQPNPVNQTTLIDPVLLHVPYLDYDTDYVYHCAERPSIIQNNTHNITTNVCNETLTHSSGKESSSDVEDSSDLSVFSKSSSDESEKLDSCPIASCQFSHDNYQKMLEHLIKVHKKYVCRYQGCNELFQYLKKRKKHETNNHSDHPLSVYTLLQNASDKSIYQCKASSECLRKKRKFNRQKLLEHLEEHHADRPAICDFCLLSYRKIGACLRHVKIKHIGQQIPCRYPECNAILPSHPGRNNHEKKEHGCLYTRINQ